MVLKYGFHCQNDMIWNLNVRKQAMNVME